MATRHLPPSPEGAQPKGRANRSQKDGSLPPTGRCLAWPYGHLESEPGVECSLCLPDKMGDLHNPGGVLGWRQAGWGSGMERWHRQVQALCRTWAAGEIPLGPYAGPGPQAGRLQKRMLKCRLSLSPILWDPKAPASRRHHEYCLPCPLQATWQVPPRVKSEQCGSGWGTSGVLTMEQEQGDGDGG